MRNWFEDGINYFIGGSHLVEEKRKEREIFDSTTLNSFKFNGITYNRHDVVRIRFSDYRDGKEHEYKEARIELLSGTGLQDEGMIIQISFHYPTGRRKGMYDLIYSRIIEIELVAQAVQKKKRDFKIPLLSSVQG